MLLQTTHSLLGSSARLNVRGATNGLVVVVRACAARCRDCAAVTACRRRMRSGRQRDRAALLKAARGFSRPNATRTEALPCCPRCGRPADVGFGCLRARVTAMSHEQQAGFLNHFQRQKKGPVSWLYGLVWRLTHTRCARYGRACRTAMCRLIFTGGWYGAKTCRCLTTSESCARATKPNGARNGATSTQVVL